MKTFVTGGSGFLGRELIASLVTAGHQVRALARSPKSEAAVAAVGATSVAGDLDAVEGMTAGMAGCDWVFHSAAHTEEWDSDERFFRINVAGTENVLAAARAAGVRRVVHISSEAAFADGSPLIRIDESRPLPEHPLPGYPRTKNLAERRAQAANSTELEVVIARPRFIWGRGDTSVLPKILDAVRSGRFKWVSGGRYLSSTCHVANACEGALLAAEKGRPGEAYFFTDGEPVELRSFLSDLMRSQKVEPPTGSVPRGLAHVVAAVTEPLWRAFGVKSAPPATRVTLSLMGEEVTVLDARARRELGYGSRISVREGLDELARLPPLA